MVDELNPGDVAEVIDAEAAAAEAALGLLPPSTEQLDPDPEFPYPDNPGQTHHDRCFWTKQHHNCALREVQRLEADIEHASKCNRQFMDDLTKTLHRAERAEAKLAEQTTAIDGVRAALAALVMKLENPQMKAVARQAVKLLPAILLFLWLGCGGRGIETADVYKVYNQDKAMLLAESVFEERYQVHVDALDEAEVFWTDTRCPYGDDWAVVVNDRCYHGITYGCGEIYVAMNRFDGETSTCHTALVHEFGHCLRLQANMGGDGNHVDTEFWDLLRTARDEGCNRGW